MEDFLNLVTVSMTVVIIPTLRLHILLKHPDISILHNRCTEIHRCSFNSHHKTCVIDIQDVWMHSPNLPLRLTQCSSQFREKWYNIVNLEAKVCLISSKTKDMHHAMHYASYQTRPPMNLVQ